jgi:hypothetical protein
VIEKMFITSTEVVQAIFSRWSFDNSVFGATTIADELHFTISAVFR